jgi:hypothetical protein
VGTTRRRVLIVAGVIALLMLLFPPWESLGGRYLGHSAITSPPGYTDSPSQAPESGLPSPEQIGRVSLPVLSVQYAALWICAGAIFFLVGRPNPR